MAAISSGWACQGEGCTNRLPRWPANVPQAALIWPVSAYLLPFPLHQLPLLKIQLTPCMCPRLKHAESSIPCSALQRFLSDLGELANVESGPSMQGRQMIMVVGPQKAQA